MFIAGICFILGIIAGISFLWVVTPLILYALYGLYGLLEHVLNYFTNPRFNVTTLLIKIFMLLLISGVAIYAIAGLAYLNYHFLQNH